MAKNKPVTGNVDNLQVNQLRGPLLDVVMRSAGMRAELMSVAREIKTRYAAKVPKDSGDLSRSVRIKAFRSNSRDRRWNVDVTIGGVNGVDYAAFVEAEYGTLATVLREMGYNTGDYIIGPRGKGAKQIPEKLLKALEEKRLKDQAENPDSTNWKLVWFEWQNNKSVRKSRFFSDPDEAAIWARNNISLEQSGKTVPNEERMSRYTENDRYERGMFSDGTNIYAALMDNRNEQQRNGI